MRTDEENKIDQQTLFKRESRRKSIKIMNDLQDKIFTPVII